MKVLCENNIDFNVFRNLIDNIKTVSNIATIGDINNIAKALNEFKPDLVLLKAENITSIVQAYCDKNNIKLISFGDNENKNAHLSFTSDNDIFRANLDILKYKDNSDKTDISVFISDERQRLFVDFLCKNYNVKVYGNIKVNSPRYLGSISEIEKYEILNKSNVAIIFTIQDFYETVLFDTYPIVYNTDNSNQFSTFNSLVSLCEQLDKINVIKFDMEILKNNIRHDNSLTFTIDTLQQLGFMEEVLKLHTILEDINK